MYVSEPANSQEARETGLERPDRSLLGFFLDPNKYRTTNTSGSFTWRFLCCFRTVAPRVFGWYPFKGDGLKREQKGTPHHFVSSPPIWRPHVPANRPPRSLTGSDEAAKRRAFQRGAPQEPREDEGGEQRGRGHLTRRFEFLALAASMAWPRFCRFLMGSNRLALFASRCGRLAVPLRYKQLKEQIFTNPKLGESPKEPSWVQSQAKLT